MINFAGPSLDAYASAAEALGVVLLVMILVHLLWYGAASPIVDRFADGLGERTNGEVDVGGSNE